MRVDKNTSPRVHKTPRRRPSRTESAVRLRSGHGRKGATWLRRCEYHPVSQMVNSTVGCGLMASGCLVEHTSPDKLTDNGVGGDGIRLQRQEVAEELAQAACLGVLGLLRPDLSQERFGAALQYRQFVD